MQAPAVIEHAALPAVREAPSDVIAFTAIIERVIADPAIDVDKLNRLLDLYQKVKASDAERLYSEAMAACQAEMEPIRATCINKQANNSLYADLADIDAKIRPIYTKHGFCPSFDIEDSPKPEHVVVVCKMRHAGGHTEISRIPMPVDGKGPKDSPVMNKTHAMGSGVTYGRRYLLCMAFNLAVTKDDDGNAAGGRRPQQQQPAPVVRQTPRFEDMVQPRTQALQPRHPVEAPIHPHPELTRPLAPSRRASPGTYDHVEPDRPTEMVRKMARAAAGKGREAFRQFCPTVTRTEYAAGILPILGELERIINDAELEIPASLRRR